MNKLNNRSEVIAKDNDDNNSYWYDLNLREEPNCKLTCFEYRAKIAWFSSLEICDLKTKSS